MTFRAAVLAALLLPTVAAADAGPISAADPGSVVEAIRAWGHKAKLQPAEGAAPVIAVERNGIKYFVYFYGCDETFQNCLDIQFYASFDVDQPLDAAWANNWNYQWVSGRVSIGTEGDPELTYYVTTVGGLTSDNFDGVMQVWDQTLTNFMTDIGWN